MLAPISDDLIPLLFILIVSRLQSKIGGGILLLSEIWEFKKQNTELN